MLICLMYRKIYRGSRHKNRLYCKYTDCIIQRTFSTLQNYRPVMSIMISSNYSTICLSHVGLYTPNKCFIAYDMLSGHFNSEAKSSWPDVRMERLCKAIYLGEMEAHTAYVPCHLSRTIPMDTCRQVSAGYFEYHSKISLVSLKTKLLCNEIIIYWVCHMFMI